MRRAALLLNPTLFSFNRIAGGADRPRPAGACVASAGRSLRGLGGTEPHVRSRSWLRRGRSHEWRRNVSRRCHGESTRTVNAQQ